MVLNIISALLVFMGIAVGAWQLSILNNKQVAIGKVVELTVGKTSKGATTFGVVASFSDLRGAAQTYTSSWKSTNPGYRVGDAIRIYYSEDHPDTNGICTFGARLGIAYIFLLTGLFLYSFKVSWPLCEKAFNHRFAATGELE